LAWTFGGDALNRKLATSDGPRIDEANRDAASADGEVAVRSTPIGDTAAERKTKTPAAKSGKGAGRSDAARSSGDVGQLLRGAYRQTVDEAIPNDLMDLLNKLE
jgi:hypothetical protein